MAHETEVVFHLLGRDRFSVRWEEGGGIPGVEGAEAGALPGNLDLDGFLFGWCRLTVPAQPGVVVADGVGQPAQGFVPIRCADEAAGQVEDVSHARASRTRFEIDGVAHDQTFPQRLT